MFKYVNKTKSAKLERAQRLLENMHVMRVYTHAQLIERKEFNDDFKAMLFLISKGHVDRFTAHNGDYQYSLTPEGMNFHDEKETYLKEWYSSLYKKTGAVISFVLIFLTFMMQFFDFIGKKT